MIIRLALVLWWLGALLLLGAVIGTAFVGSKQFHCRSVSTELAAWQSKADAVHSKARGKDTSGSGGLSSEDAIDKALAASSDEEVDKELARIAAGGVEPKREGLDDEIQQCERSGEAWVWPVALAIAGLPLLILAYILGGSLFRPPRPR